jgi:hypothetical protein
MGRPFNELLQYFAMERFLYRLSKSPHAEKFILKGALMLTVWEAVHSRPTMVIDVLGQIDNSIETIVSVTKDICHQDVETDGIVFDATSVEGERITEDADYEGVRVRFRGNLGAARITMQLDVGFGDVVIPAIELADYPTILDFPAPCLSGYSKESTVAEKLEAMVKLGILNSRMKDFFDIWFLSCKFDFVSQTLMEATKKTFAIRETDIPSEPIALTRTFAEDTAKSAQWRGFIRKNRITDIPEDFDDIITAIANFLKPIVVSLSEDGIFMATWKAPGPWRE